MNAKVPSAITQITLNRATFDNESVEQLSFVNFFYGNNGAGKSSIAYAIQEQDGITWNYGESPDRYDLLVYNTEYINRNFVNYGELKGVFVFGEEDAEAKQKINILTGERKQTTDKRDAARTKYKTIQGQIEAILATFQDEAFSKVAELRKRFEKALDGKKQKRSFAEAIIGEKHPMDYDIDALKRLCNVAFDNEAQAYPEFKKASSAITYGSMPGRELIDKIVTNSGDTPFAKFLQALGAKASDWVRDGHTHYVSNANGHCPFCQQELPASFEADIAACFDEQYNADIRDLQQFQATYERETTIILCTLQSNLTSVLPGLDIRAYTDKLELLSKNFEINRQRIASKVKEPATTVSLEDTDTLLFEISSLIDDINAIIKDNNEVVSQKRTSKQKCKEQIIQYLAFLLSKEVSSYLDEKEKLETELEQTSQEGKALNAEITRLNQEIAALNKHNVNTEATIESINRILKDSGFQGFSIRAKKNIENVYEIVREDGSVAEYLSEGERNFIAFLYFYHQVRGSMTDTELKEKIVVIDDPVSSMDSTALFIVSAIVREMINVCLNNTEYKNPKVPGDYIKQIFILTHNVYFHREVTYHQVSNYKSTSFYMIRKMDNESTVKLCIRQRDDEAAENENYNPVQNSYAALWDELRDIKTTIPTINVMRRILEYYFLQLCGYEGSDLREIVLENPDNRKMFIKEIEGKKPDMTEYHLASSLLAYINNPNGISDGLNYVEDCEDARIYKKVFKKIFEALHQNQHYQMMTGRQE